MEDKSKGLKNYTLNSLETSLYTGTFSYFYMKHRSSSFSAPLCSALHILHIYSCLSIGILLHFSQQLIMLVICNQRTALSSNNYTVHFFLAIAITDCCDKHNLSLKEGLNLYLIFSMLLYLPLEKSRNIFHIDKIKQNSLQMDSVFQRICLVMLCCTVHSVVRHSKEHSAMNIRISLRLRFGICLHQSCSVYVLFLIKFLFAYFQADWYNSAFASDFK